ncbi:MAG: hypothetical protein ACREGK_05770, partial [Geminicoccales bacterium]
MSGAPGKDRLEVFQRAVGATCRAMSGRPGLTVSFKGRDPGRERTPGDAPNVVLPVPRRTLASQDVGRIRGEADG